MDALALLKEQEDLFAREFCANKKDLISDRRLPQCMMTGSAWMDKGGENESVYSETNNSGRT